MATLTKREILDAIYYKKLEFEPELDQFQIQPNSIDLRVGWNFYIPKTWEYNERGRVALSGDCLNCNLKKENYR